MKYVTATIAFLFIWLASAFLIGLVIAMFVKVDHPIMIGIGFDPLNLPGTIIGLLAGIHSARATIRKANAKAAKKAEREAQTAKTET